MITSIAAYLFTRIDDPATLATRVREAADSRALRGTVLVAGEGINLVLAGSADGIDGFLAELRRVPALAALEVKRSHGEAWPFARLKVKVKREIIAFRHDGATPVGGRAPAVAATDLARWIATGHDDQGRRLVLLDTRNREEVGHGTFAGAVTLPIDRFTDFPAALAPYRDAFVDATVVSFCTGGIRCEKAALWMRGAGMDNVLQLDGGILGYFEQVGGDGYTGACFVFDARIALDAGLRPVAQVAA